LTNYKKILFAISLGFGIAQILPGVPYFQVSEFFTFYSKRFCKKKFSEIFEKFFLNNSKEIFSKKALEKFLSIVLPLKETFHVSKSLIKFEQRKNITKIRQNLRSTQKKGN